MIQTQENGKKTHFGPDLGQLDQNSDQGNFFSKIWLCQSLDIMIFYHHVQYQKNIMIQSWKKRPTGESTRCTTSKEKKEESTEKVPREKKYV